MDCNSPHPETPHAGPLLAPEDGPAASVLNPCGRSPFLLLGDHAGNRIPGALGALGLGEADLARHIAWDLGIAALGEVLSERLDAPFVSQRFSRLVIDCNRDPASAAAIPTESDGTDIPGNHDLAPSARAQRVKEIHTPYHQAVAGVAAHRAPVIVSLHSFTPVMAGTARPWSAGVLHDGANDAFALAVLDHLSRHSDIFVGDNAPYRMDGTDFTIPFHAFERRLAYVELEIRQDLLVADVSGWAERLENALGVCAIGLD